jgi:hypothetical protein
MTEHDTDWQRAEYMTEHDTDWQSAEYSQHLPPDAPRRYDSNVSLPHGSAVRIQDGSRRDKIGTGRQPSIHDYRVQ